LLNALNVLCRARSAVLTLESNERRKRHATCDINISHKDGSRQAQHVIETRNEAIYAGHRN